MRLTSQELEEELLLGELAGRCYWDSRTHRFERNRRHTDRRRELHHGYWRDQAVEALLELAAYPIVDVDPDLIPPNEAQP